MQISWLGQSAIKIEFKTSQSEGTLIIDPYEHSTETMPRSVASDITILTHGEKNTIPTSKEGCTIAEAGEYEYKEVLVYGFQTAYTPEAPLIYRLEAEHVTLAHLGLATTLDEKLINELQGIDVLMLPIGGSSTMTPERAVELVTKIEPRIVIPYAFNATGTGEDYASPMQFTKLLGQDAPEPQNKFKLAKKDLPSDTLQIVILEKQ